MIAGAVGCAIAGLVWTFIGPAQSGDGDLGGYPERIAKPYVEHSLPDHLGPLAAIVEDNDFGNVRYHGVSEFGRVWALPRLLRSPTLSPDGRQLLALAGDDVPRLTLRDLGSGESVEFEVNGYDATWSPDGGKVALTTETDQSRRVPIWIDLSTGEIHQMGFRGLVAGWRSADELVVLASRKPKGEPRTVIARVVNSQSGTTHSVPLTSSVPWKWFPNQASVSPGGRLLVTNDRRFEFFDLSSGERLETREVKDATSCEISWRVEDPIIGTKVYGTPARSMLVRSELPPQSLVAVHPKFQSNCVTWAADAINGDVHRGLFGTNSERWTWYWREALALVAVTIVIVVLTRGRRKQSGGSDAPGTSNPPD